MTVTYVEGLATSRKGAFLKLLIRWRASVYKVLWPDLLIFLFLYYLLRYLYMYGLNEPQKRMFEFFVEYCEVQSNYIPLSFVLGFYVTLIMNRWWTQYLLIPWPDSLAINVSSVIEGQVGLMLIIVLQECLQKTERSRLMRRTVMRYVNIAFLLTFCQVSTIMKKRFPTLDEAVKAGIVTEEEKIIIEEVTSKVNTVPFWLPLVWACTIIRTAHKERKIRSPVHVQALIDKISEFRLGCGRTLDHSWVNVPLIYTQVVTLAVYSFFLACLMSRQFVKSTDKKYSSHYIDIHVPIYTILEFIFYMGWLKVAGNLINPYGEDDDDFEISYLLDRNLTVSYTIVDDMHNQHPFLVKDQYWDESRFDDNPRSDSHEVIYPSSLLSTLKGIPPKWIRSPFTNSFIKIDRCRIDSDANRKSIFRKFDNKFSGRMSVWKEKSRLEGYINKSYSTDAIIPSAFYRKFSAPCTGITENKNDLQKNSIRSENKDRQEIQETRENQTSQENGSNFKQEIANISDFENSSVNSNELEDKALSTISSMNSFERKKYLSGGEDN